MSPGSSLDEVVEDWNSRISAAINEMMLSAPLLKAGSVGHSRVAVDEADSESFRETMMAWS